MAYSSHTASNKVIIMEVVMRPLRRHRHIVPSVFAAPPDLIRLWVIRLIVPLGGLQEFINRQYKELYILIGSFEPDQDTLQKLLYQGACAFFQIGCSMELHNLGAGLK